MSWRYGRLLPAFGLPGDEWLIADTVTAGESHGAQPSAVECIQNLLTLGWCEAQPTVAAGADNGGVGGGGSDDVDCIRDYPPKSLFNGGLNSKSRRVEQLGRIDTCVSGVIERCEFRKRQARFSTGG